jgi:hypothetical protein
MTRRRSHPSNRSPHDYPTAHGSVEQERGRQGLKGPRGPIYTLLVSPIEPNLSDHAHGVCGNTIAGMTLATRSPPPSVMD